MKHIKRIAVITLITLISLTSAFIPYLGVNGGLFAYAESTRTLTDDEIDAAMIAYIQSHGGGFSASDHRMNKWYIAQKFNTWLFGEGSTFTREDFLQHVEAGKNQDDGLFFKFDGIAAGFLMNKMLGNNTPWNESSAEYDSETGLFDTGTDDSVYNGKLLTDNHGNDFLVWIINGAYTKNLYTNSSVQQGSFIQGKFADNISNGDAISFSYYEDSQWKNKTYTFNTSVSGKEFQFAKNNSAEYSYGYGNSPLACTSNPYRAVGKCTYITEYYNGQKYTVGGGFGYCYSTTSDKLYVGCIGKDLRYEVTYINADSYFDDSYKNNTINVDVNFYTNNNLNITNYPDIDADGSLYITPKVKINGEYKPYIINEGDTINNVINNYYNDSGEKDKTIAVPTTTPDSGGGGNNPVGGTPPNWSNPYPNLSPDGNGGFNFNFSLPDLNIDWNINGLTEKFPFSIPFDFIAFCRVLNAEPQAPEWSGTLSLPMVNYPFSFSLQQFDSVATLLRNMEFIGFCIALILATRALIKG